MYVGYFPHSDDEYNPSLSLPYAYKYDEKKIDFLKSENWFRKINAVNSYATQYRLTSVGICIAIANIKRRTNDVYNFMKWIS